MDNQKNKRTYKSEDEKLNHRIEVRFTKAEMAELRQNVANSKYNSIAAYIRAKIYNKNITTVVSKAVLEKQTQIRQLLLGLSSEFSILISYLNDISARLDVEHYPTAETIQKNITLLFDWAKRMSALIGKMKSGDAKNMSEVLKMRDHQLQEQLIELGAQLPPIGNNLNQMAHRMNVGDSVPLGALQKDILSLKNWTVEATQILRKLIAS